MSKRVTGGTGGQPILTDVPAAPPKPELKAPQTALDAVVANLPDSAIISALIGGVGSVAVHELFGIPYDLAVSATFATVGTIIGAAYGPAKQAVIDTFASHAHRHGAPLVADSDQVPTAS